MKLEYQRNPTEERRSQLEDKWKLLRRVEDQLGSVTQADTQVLIVFCFIIRATVRQVYSKAKASVLGA